MNKNYILCVAGDMNARVGNKPIHFVLGTNGENTVDQDGRKLIEFATENELRITNTFFKHKDIHKFTWSAINCRSIIDYALVNKKTATLVKDARVYRGADIHSDHFLVIAKLAVHKRWRKNTVLNKT
jgi:endonuclease/exonuclease/phosphatase family metal-dependent hydrolase